MLFYVQLKIQEGEKKENKEEKAIKKLIDQVELIPDKTRLVNAKELKKKLRQILEKNEKPPINERFYCILEKEEVEILKNVFERLGYEFKAEFLPSDHPYVKAWEEKFKAKNDIKGFFEYIYLSKGEIESHEITKEKDKSTTKLPPNILKISINEIDKKIEETGKEIDNLKEKYEENKETQTKQEESKQTTKSISIKEAVEVDGINFNKKVDEKDESSYKIQLLIEGKEVEYQANLEQKVKGSNRTRGEILLEKINEITKPHGLEFVYDEGYPKKIEKNKKIYYLVKLKSKSEIREEKVEENEGSKIPAGIIFPETSKIGGNKNKEEKKKEDFKMETKSEKKIDMQSVIDYLKNIGLTDQKIKYFVGDTPFSQTGPKEAPNNEFRTGKDLESLKDNLSFGVGIKLKNRPNVTDVRENEWTNKGDDNWEKIWTFKQKEKQYQLILSISKSNEKGLRTVKLEFK